MESFHTIEISAPEFTPPGVTHITVKSTALGRRADISVYRPLAATDDQSLPLVILLHGVYGSHWAWMGKGGAHATLERLIRDEALPPMVLAMPSDGLFGDGSGYIKHADADYTDWIVKEVPLAVAHLPGRVDANATFITGLSMGGYGALRLGALHPQRFRAFSGMSSVTDFRNMERFVAASGHRYDVTESQPLALADCLLQNRNQLSPFIFDCGSEDFLVEENRHLHHFLCEASIPHQYQEHPGGHEWPYWQNHLADQLRFFAHHLA